MDKKFKVFISWSKSESKEAAKIIKKYLIKLDGRIEAFFSDNDISIGSRSIKVIEENLSSADYSIVLLSKESMNSQWVNFETGYLASKPDRNVAILLINMEIENIKPLPFYIFQNAKIDSDGLNEVFKAIYTKVNGDFTNLDTFNIIFNGIKSDLLSELNSISKESQIKPDRSVYTSLDFEEKIITLLNRNENTFMEILKKNRIVSSSIARTDIVIAITDNIKLFEFKSVARKINGILEELGLKIIDTNLYLNDDSDEFTYALTVNSEHDPLIDSLLSRELEKHKELGVAEVTWLPF